MLIEYEIIFFYHPADILNDVTYHPIDNARAEIFNLSSGPLRSLRGPENQYHTPYRVFSLSEFQILLPTST